MNTEMKRCARCGETKSIDNFRHYYNTGRKGTYRHCKECERIETRRKYLVARGDAMTPEQRKALDAINKLYSIRESMGLSVPRTRTDIMTTDDIVAEQLKELL